MNKLLSTLALSTLAMTVIGQNVQTENFNGCSLPGGWTNTAVQGPNNWQFGASAPAVGSVDGTCFAFIDDDDLGSGAAALIADLETPTYDLSAYGMAEFRFDYIFEDIAGSSLSVSFWNGSSWNVVWTENSDPGCFGFYPDCAPRQAAISMTGYMNADFKAKFTYNDNNSWAWWAAIDNFAIYLPPAVDGALVGIASPVSGCGMAQETVSLLVYNNGQTPITAVDASYTLDGGSQVSETFTVTIAPGDTGTVSFATLADVSALGPHTIDATIIVNNDADPANDAFASDFINIPVLGASLPYFQDFENGDGGWVAGGTNNTWALGQPSGTFIDAAFSGVNAFVTNLAGQYNNLENSFIESPCLDFSSLVVDPVLRFKHIFTTEACCDEGWVDISYDAGITWTRLGAVGTGDNWYNDQFNNWWNGTSGNATEWRTALHLLDGAAGESSVKIRFFFSSDGSVVAEGFGIDDIEIFEQPAINGGITQIVSPVTGCGLGLSDVTVVITNFGENDLSNFDVSYDAGNGPVVEQFTGTIAGGQTSTFTFATQLDLTVSGAYTITASTDVPNDGDNGNDTLTVNITNSPVVAGLPYVEDFETSAGGWYGEIESGDFNSWEWGQPAGLFIDAANSGVNAWVTSLAGQYQNNENSYLVSPCFDFSALTLDPILSFAHIFETESCCDEGWVDLSVDGGVTWTKVGTFGEGENWYNNEFNNWWNGSSGAAGAWRNASHILDGAAGQSSVKIRFFFSSDGSVVADGFGVDDVRIEEQPSTNGALVSIDSPASGCDLSASETVSVTVTNVGSDDISPISISYQVNGGAVVTQDWTETLSSFQTDNYTFDEAIDLSAPGDYTLTVWFNVPGDGNTENDTLSTLVQSVPTVSNVPYFINFENGTGGWTASGTNGTWELGGPQGNLINAAYSGENAWSTNLNTLNYANNQQSYLTSPCIDFSNVTDDPIIDFAIIHNTEAGWDGTVLEVSIDGGTTWSVLGTVGSGINWYNSDFDGWWDGQSNGNTTWMIAQHILEGVAGQSAVRVRFNFTSDGSANGFEGVAVDDISIYAQPQLDLAAVSFDGPSDGCNLNNGQVSFTFWNRGLQTVTGFEVGFAVDGGSLQTETANVTLAQGDTVTYTFTTQFADLSGVGSHTIDVFTLLAGDEFPANDDFLGGTVINYGASTPLSQSIQPNAIISDTQVNGTSSTIYFCGIQSGLSDGCLMLDNVTIGSLAHTFVSDMTIYLISPAGDTVLLTANNGGTGQNLANVVFSGGSTNDITLQTAGIAPGTYAPQDENGFSTFYDGQDPNGGWTLYIEDGFFGDQGVLENWSMTFVDNSPVVVLPYSDTTICLTHVLDVTVPDTYDSYLWSTGQNTQTASLFGNVLGLGQHVIYVSVDQNGCSGISNSFKVTVDACIGVEENGGLHSVGLYPNPNNGLFNVSGEMESASDITIEVLDLAGRQVMPSVIIAGAQSFNQPLNAAELANGLYMVRVSTYKGASTLRFSKQ
jgi:subtilisin-like proprotein convertase family protein